MGRHCGAARAGRVRLGILRRALAFAILGIVLGLSGACSGDDNGASPTPTSASVATPTAGAPAGDSAATVESAVQACREKNAEMLSALVAVAVSDDDITTMFARGDDVLLSGRTFPEIEGNRATVEVTLEVRRGPDIEHVQRTWELERASDGVWRFTALPDCY